MVTCYKYEMVEEKKTEDAHEAPLDDESESSSASSIIKKGELFVDGLDSSLSSLISTDENASSILKKGELLADGLDSSMSSLISTDENLDLNPPLMERRSVSFTGIGTSPASAANIPTGASGVESEIKKLREKMTEAQIDYQAEKATRKRKEKNLVKLAKELNKRTTEIDFKDRQIKRVSLFHSILRACLRSRKLFSLRIHTINSSSRMNQTLHCSCVFFLFCLHHCS